jgi:predicted nucleic acid-binding protein
MRVCFDINVVLDILVRSEDFADSYAAYDTALSKGFETYIPVLATGTIAYMLQRHLHDKTKVRDALRALSDMVGLFDEQPSDYMDALESDMPDFEDALLAHGAARNGMDVIITRNISDFAASPVQAVTPAVFLSMFKPANVEYAVMDVEIDNGV